MPGLKVLDHRCSAGSGKTEDGARRIELQSSVEVPGVLPPSGVRRQLAFEYRGAR